MCVYICKYSTSLPRALCMPTVSNLKGFFSTVPLGFHTHIPVGMGMTSAVAKPTKITPKPSFSLDPFFSIYIDIRAAAELMMIASAPL